MDGTGNTKDPLGILAPTQAPAKSDPLGLLSQKKSPNQTTSPASTNGYKPSPADVKEVPGRISGESLPKPEDLIATINYNIANQDPKTKAYWNSLSPKEREAINEGAFQSEQQHQNEGIRALTKEEVEHHKFMETPLGKTVGAMTYLGSKADKGVVDIAKGGAWIFDHMNTGLANTQSQGEKDFWDKLDDLTDHGLTKGDISHYENDPGMGAGLLRTGGMFANMAPAMVGGEITKLPKLMFAMQGMGQAKTSLDEIKKSGVEVNPLVEDAYVMGSGAAQGLLMGDLGENVFGKLAPELQGKIVQSIAADALKEAGGKVLTTGGYKELLQKGAKDLADKVTKFGIQYLDKFNKTTVDLGALNLAQGGLKLGADAANKEPIFNETPGQVAESVMDAPKQAALFATVGQVPELTKLTPFSNYNNDIIEHVSNHPEQADDVKQQMVNYGVENGWTPDEIKATNDHIGQVADAAKKLPKTMPAENKPEAVQTVIDRDALQKKLADIQSEKQDVDPLFKDKVSPEEDMLTNMVDQKNDKLLKLNGDKITYSKGTGDDEGKFFKTINGKQEEISENRYKLENLSRKTKSENESNTNEGREGGQSTAAENEEQAGQAEGPQEPSVQEGRNDDEGRQDLKQPGAGEAQAEPAIPEKDFKGKSDAEIENRLTELQDKMDNPENLKNHHPDYPSWSAEFDSLEKEMERREKDSVFNAPLDKASVAIDALMKKEKEQPNGWGAFIEKRDALESKAVIEKYTTGRDDISDSEVRRDFKEALLGNPDTWYADGLKLRESANLAAERGIDINDMLGDVEKEFTKDGYDKQTAKEVIARRLAKIFKPQDKSEPELKQLPSQKGEPNAPKENAKPESPEAVTPKANHGNQKEPAIPEKETSVDNFKIGDQDEFYHASPTKREGPLREGEAPQFGKGTYFSTNKDLVINEFGKELTKVNLKLEKPLYTGTKEEQEVRQKAADNWNKENLTWDKDKEEWVDKQGKSKAKYPLTPEDLGEGLPVKYLSDAAKEMGYDAIIDKNSRTYDNEIVVLDPKKIVYKDEKGEPNATKEQSAGKMDVGEQAQDGGKMGEGNAEPKEPAQKSKIKKPEKEKLTGIRNEDIEKERGEAVPREKRSIEQIDAEGKRLVDSGEVDPEKLAREINKGDRAVTAEEEAALLYHKKRLENRQRSLLKDSEEHPENAAENHIKWAAAEDAIEENRKATELAGNIGGRSLRFRQEQLKEDYSRVHVIQRAKQANGGEPLSPELEKELTERTKRIKDLEGQLSDREEQIRKLQEQRAVDKVGEVQRRTRGQVTREKLRKEREELKAELHVIARKTLSSAGANKIPIDMIVPLGKLAVNYVADGINTLAMVVDKIYNDLGGKFDKDDIKDAVKGEFDKEIQADNQRRLEATKKRQLTKLEKLKEQNETNSTEERVARKLAVDNDYLAIRAEIKREQGLINKRIDQINNSKKSLGRKIVDAAVKYGRQAKLFSVTVLGKLSATGLTTLAVKVPQEIVGAGISKLTPKLAEGAPFEAGARLSDLGKSYAKAATKGMKDAYDELNIKKGGMSDLSALYGKYVATRLPAEAADFFGHLHSAIKAPFKRAIWEYSYAKRFAATAKMGLDPLDPITDAKNRLDAYKDAERAIFMGDNKLSSAYEAGMRTLENSNSTTAKNVAALSRILFPFVKVPTNIALEAGRSVFGLPAGLAKLSRIYGSEGLRKIGADKLANVIHKGIDNMTSEEKELVYRNLKVGSIGGAALLVGFFNPKSFGGFYRPGKHDTDKKADIGGIMIGGVKIPRWLTEHPIFLAMQVGATFRQVLEERRKKGDGVEAASLATASGLAGNIPLANGAQQIFDALGSSNKLNKYVGNVVKGEVEPAALQQLAEITDTKHGQAFSFSEKEQQKRKPTQKKGFLKYIGQTLEIGVPGLRKNVPKK